MPDELGLPNFIDATGPEFGDTPDLIQEVIIDLPTMAAEVDKVRVNLRSGITLRINELWHTGLFTVSIQTAKGQRDIFSIDPSRAGMAAVRIFQVSDVL